MNFYEKTSGNLANLTNTERNLFNYIIKNLHLVKNMSIRELANECFVSTTTLFRFVRKLGYEGYTDFIEAVKQTEQESRKINIPSVVNNDNYRESYLKNVIEAVKVIPDDKIEKFNAILNRNPHIYILAEGLSHEIAHYFYRLLTSIGFDVEMPREEYEFLSLLRRIRKEDLLLVLSYSGNNRSVINQIERIFAIATPIIISFTRADNNVIQNMSDLNFYVFADEINYEGIDMTSRCGMIAVIEMLLYKRLTITVKSDRD